jgi:hypothetical protein
MATTTEIRVLSVRQPFAHWLLHSHPVLGPKSIENRSWVSKYRGPVYIHASRWDACPEPNDPDAARFWDVPEDQKEQAHQVGAILGCVDLVFSCDQIDAEEVFYVLAGESSRKLNPRQQELLKYVPHDTSDPAWEWWAQDGMLIVRNPRVLVDPIPTGGKLNLWRFNVEPERLVFREPEPPKQPEPPKKPKRSPGRRKK